MRVFVRTKGFYEDSLGQTGECGTVHATRRRKCILSLDTINTEASKLKEGMGV